MQIMLTLARSRFALWMLVSGCVLLPAIAGVSAELRGRSKARFTRQVIDQEPTEEMPAEPAPPLRRSAPMQPPLEPMPADEMPADDMPTDELPAAPRGQRASPRTQTQRGSVVMPYENEWTIGDLGGYSPQTARRLGICYPQTGACGLACGGCFPCRTWGSIDFVYAWRKGQTYPPLVTSSPIGTRSDVAGILTTPGTRVLFGGDTLDSFPMPGGRAEFGIWGNQCQIVGIGGRFLAIGDEFHSFNLSNADNPIIGIPFFDVDPRLAGNAEVGENAFLVAHPTLSTGTVGFNSRASLYAGDAFVRFKFWEDCMHRLDFTAGYTFARIGDGFTLRSASTQLNAPGNRFDIVDEFTVVNRFDGVSPGALYSVRGNCWSFMFLGKCGLGTMRHTAQIHGSTTTTTAAGAVTVTNGGIFAQATNIGRHEVSEFAVMPEAQVKIGYRILPALEATLGYNGIYWNRAAQAGALVDRSVNGSQFTPPLVGAPRPEFAFHLSDYWVQGITLGLQGAY